MQALPPSVYLILALLTIGWGMNWPMIKIALTELPPFTFRAVCVLAGALGMFAIARISGTNLRLERRYWWQLALLALCNVTLWGIFSVLALRHLPAGRGAVLAYTMPIWTILLSRALLGEPITRRRWAGLILGIAAMMLLLGDDLIRLSAAPVGTLLMIGAALSWALGTVLMKRYPLPLSVSALTAWQFCAGGIPLLFGALFETHALKPLSTGPLAALLYNMIVSFVICHWAWFKIVAIAPAGVAALSTQMIPVVGVISGMLVLGEQPRWQELTALALVSAALTTVLLPARRPLIAARR